MSGRSICAAFLSVVIPVALLCPAAVFALLDPADLQCTPDKAKVHATCMEIVAGWQQIGMCIAENDCQWLQAISPGGTVLNLGSFSGTVASVLGTLGAIPGASTLATIGASSIFSMLSGGGGGSGSSPQSFEGDLATAALAPPDLVPTGIPPSNTNPLITEPDRISPLLENLKAADPARISIANAVTTPSTACASTVGDSSEIAQLKRALDSPTCLVI